MSRVTFSRKRVKLKKLLGIRTRLALLALMLVAPLMLEHVRALEETRAKQLAQAPEDYKGLVQHSADTHRPDRGGRRGALRRQTSRPQHRGRAWICQAGG